MTYSELEIAIEAARQRVEDKQKELAPKYDALNKEFDIVWEQSEKEIRQLLNDFGIIEPFIEQSNTRGMKINFTLYNRFPKSNV